MVRSAALTILVVCTFGYPASAEQIGLKNEHAIAPLPLDVAWRDAIQTLVIAAADSDWRESAGADVWWLSSNSLEAQVKVFPGLQHPGNVEPQCCVSFTVGDTTFWLKLKTVTLETTSNPSHHLPKQTDSIFSPSSQQLRRSEWAATGVVEHRSHTGPAVTFEQSVDSPTAAAFSSASGTNSLQTQATDDNSIAQVPEPAAVLLLGIGLTTAAHRLRIRSQPNPKR